MADSEAMKAVADALRALQAEVELHARVVAEHVEEVERRVRALDGEVTRGVRRPPGPGPT